MKAFIVFFLLLSSNIFAASIEIKGLKSDYQGMAPWCWASAAKMVLGYHGIKTKTCTIVSKEKGDDCCGVTPAQCWDGGNVIDALAHYNIHYKFDLLVSDEKVPLNAKVAERIINMLKKGQVPVIRLNNTAPNGFNHVAVIKAVHDYENLKTLKFEIYDPANGKLKVPASELLYGYYTVPGARYYFDGLFYPAGK
jgi:hypothetical protein